VSFKVKQVQNRSSRPQVGLPDEKVRSAPKVLVWVCGVVAAFSTLAGAASAEADSHNAVQLGSVLPFTGPEAAPGRNIAQAMLLAIEDVNAAGSVKKATERTVLIAFECAGLGGEQGADCTRENNKRSAEHAQARWDAECSLPAGEHSQAGVGSEYEFDDYGAAEHIDYELWKVNEHRIADAGTFNADCKLTRA
jgi:hypothetical protein